jgi:hypothetical protein
MDWLVCCLLAGPDLLKCSITMIFTCSLLSWYKLSSRFRENSDVVVFPFPSHIFMPLAKMWFIRLQGIVSHPMDKKFPGFYPLIRPPGRPLALGKGGIFIPGFIRSPPTLAVFDVRINLPLFSTVVPSNICMFLSCSPFVDN